MRFLRERKNLMATVVPTFLVALFALTWGAIGEENEVATSQSLHDRSPPATLPQSLDLVCQDGIKAACANFSQPVTDATGTVTDPARGLHDISLKLREYYREKIATNPRVITELNKMVHDPTIQDQVKDLTAIDCKGQEARPCEAQQLKALNKIFEDQTVTHTGFKDEDDIRCPVIFGKSSSCSYVESQYAAFRVLQRKGTLDAIEDLQEQGSIEFLKTQNQTQEQHIAKDLFPKIKRQMSETLKTMNLAPDALKAVLKKMQSTTLSFDCKGAGQNLNGLAYSSIGGGDRERKIIICPGLLAGNTSDFAIVWALSHELSHQFDPCYIHFGNEGFHYKPIADVKTQNDFVPQNPFATSLSCLQDPNGVGAVPTSNFYPKYFPQDLDLNAPPEKFKAPFCKYDRIQEAFSDAMGVKVTADYFSNRQNIGNKPLSKRDWQAGLVNISKMLLNLNRSPCGGEDSHRRLYEQNETDDYPSPNARINATILANQKIRRLAGCDQQKSAYPQCL